MHRFKNVSTNRNSNSYTYSFTFHSQLIILHKQCKQFFNNIIFEKGNIWGNLRKPMDKLIFFKQYFFKFDFFM